MGEVGSGVKFAFWERFMLNVLFLMEREIEWFLAPEDGDVWAQGSCVQQVVAAEAKPRLPLCRCCDARVSTHLL